MKSLAYLEGRKFVKSSKPVSEVTQKRSITLPSFIIDQKSQLKGRTKITVVHRIHKSDMNNLFKKCMYFALGFVIVQLTLVQLIIAMITACF